ncbi:hypothetical protein ABB37_05524 [Leptomonas pyrrhocoris]|uniref:Uncharacterized protein n=1 Tax=Leptomonas pyrrhocoris TaxID=157538 RepID=A0A0N0VF74_LEPPY|nr:hypothetical protein ABB37_05524 [Leptomonas pyrrhocoris]XP_015658219.1 hypothetical protein ABB37_05524 [Leptomonas pyrrhocoris]XP_015658220.1 hypothetical protein ABB37_05524 [Leptomonas pyrrhocoris]XP_015658221.1 hypothetical protein ABB37_05524 [Leptomonas pyrrhocoris]KPA79779.1 hypothetical protein ABB37_05524 [Leptomonas pyrrhocoris]KPA79780.1 hypothetical protein ABB37_05524 [Leptomonas pyrrhocoris]KPA79781.1 hypothetical protein ABB37_05524 [Leptomonas pyrrhocoris]KPA79782.1 hypot|eukprot:XP_015658218.1 hypothetical protein ABB37_05524 [Leptomonas pyrrhocoris]
MPPRRQSSPKSRSRSKSSSPRKSSSARPSAQTVSKSPSLPPPDPAAVQRLIDEAIARAQRNRAANRGAAAPDTASVSSNEQLARPGCLSAARSFLFGSRNCMYSPSTTAALTDVIGAFLVTCITVYFTVSGYLFYRELATGE